MLNIASIIAKTSKNVQSIYRTITLIIIRFFQYLYLKINILGKKRDGNFCTWQSLSLGGLTFFL